MWWHGKNVSKNHRRETELQRVSELKLWNLIFHILYPTKPLIRVCFHIFFFWLPLYFFAIFYSATYWFDMMWWYEFLEKVTGNAFISHHTLNAFSYSLCSLHTHLYVHKLSDIVSSYICVHFSQKKKFLYFLYSLVNRFHSTCNTYGDRDILCFFKIIFIFISLLNACASMYLKTKKKLLSPKYVYTLDMTHTTDYWE